MPSHTATLLIPGDVGARWGSQQSSDLAAELEQRINQPVVVCSPDASATPLTAAIQELVNADHQALVVMPLGLLPVSTNGDISLTLGLAKRQWPNLAIRVAAPLTWLEWSSLLRVTALDAANQSGIPPEDVAVLIVSESSENPLVNADLARLAHLVREGNHFAGVGYSFLETTPPDIPEAILSLTASGVQNVIVVPWLFAQEEILQRLAKEIDYVVRVDGLNVKLAPPTLAHPAMVNLLVSNHYVAVSDDSHRFGATEEVGPQVDLTVSSTSAMTSQDMFELQELERRINSMLPSEYQGQYEAVKPTSMGTASLKFDDAGKVAWGDIWTSFCDLALAGGPPHRGTLLEAVSSADALAEPEQYEAVVAEIERGIKLVTSLPVITSKTPGWVGVRCESEEMAVWLMRAIIVENIMVRREGDVLFLPAGPRFTVKREIKNVITAIAKTVHYWSTHLLARRQSVEGRL
ncbi:MAG TPA: CbiX/SirB N-terminal domain-containing protein [Schlesneria sp.]